MNNDYLIILRLTKFKKVPFTKSYHNFENIGVENIRDIFLDLIYVPYEIYCVMKENVTMLKEQTIEIIKKAEQVTRTIKNKLSTSDESGK